MRERGLRLRRRGIERERNAKCETFDRRSRGSTSSSGSTLSIADGNRSIVFACGKSSLRKRQTSELCARQGSETEKKTNGDDDDDNAVVFSSAFTIGILARRRERRRDAAAGRSGRGGRSCCGGVDREQQREEERGGSAEEHGELREREQEREREARVGLCVAFISLFKTLSLLRELKTSPQSPPRSYIALRDTTERHRERERRKSTSRTSLSFLF